MKKIVLLLLLVSLSFSSLLWQLAADGAISSKPTVYQGMIIAASDDGNIYAIDPNLGTRRWKAVVGKEPNEVFVFDNAIITSTTAGKITRLDRDGKPVWVANLNVTSYNVSYVYGASANTKEIFVSANNGIYIIEKNGSVRTKLVSFNSSIVTAPAAGPDYVIYGTGNQLLKVRETGLVEWNAKLDEGSFWTSRPVIDSVTVYIGALDNKMHAYLITGGTELWQSRTRSWIMSTPLVKEGIVYFGSNDGGIYAAYSDSGTKRWDAQTPLAIQSDPEAGFIGGKEAIFIGGSDKSAYAIDRETGEIVWKGTTAGAVGSPLFYQNLVIFGSQDKNLYAYSTERACSITAPHEADVLGLKEVVVSGKYVSESGGASVWININGAGWEQSNTSNVDWVYYLNPKLKLNPGLNIISCKVVDASGEETGEAFTSVAVTHDPNIPLSNFVVTVSPAILEGDPFTIYVNDGDDGSPVDRFTLNVDGKNQTGNKNVTLKIPQPGSYKVTVRKIGFNDAAVTVNVNAKGVSPIFLVVGVILILIILWYVWTRFLGQRFTKPKK